MRQLGTTQKGREGLNPRKGPLRLGLFCAFTVEPNEDINGDPGLTYSPGFKKQKNKIQLQTHPTKTDARQGQSPKNLPYPGSQADK